MKNLIGNEWRDSSNSKIISVFNPATADIIDTIPDSTVSDVNMSINIAKDCFKFWKKVSFDDRVNIFKKFLLLLKAEQKDVAVLLSRESGQSIIESMEQIRNIEFILKSIIEKAKFMFIDNKEISSNTVGIKILEPLGIIGIIISSSDVIYSFCYKVFSALIMGNTVVLKPSELVPLTLTKLCYLLRLSGVLSGVIQVVHGQGNTVGKVLAMNPFVKLISLDGDLKTGLNIRSATSRKLGKELLQLNGNDALILFGDGDVSKAVDFTIESRLSQSGQSSIGPKRFIIHESLKEEYLTKLFATLRNIKMGDPMDNNSNIGSLVSESRARQIELHINKTIQEGAEVLYGGHRYKAFFEPTVLFNMNENMSIMKTSEVLGPVIPVITFSDIDEAIRIANNIPYGINNYVFTKNTDIIFKCMDRLESANVIVNATKNINLYNSYFGGWKLSGNNSPGIEELLRSFFVLKKVILKNE